MMDKDGFTSPEERKFFDELARKFIDRADAAWRKGTHRKRQMTEQVFYNGYHEITLTRFDVHNCGGWKGWGLDDRERNVHDLCIKLRKMVTGK